MLTRSLAPPIVVDGPRVRLGVLWGAVSLGALVAGGFASSLVFAAVALAAAGQASVSWYQPRPPKRPPKRRPYRPVAVGGAVLIALAGAGGPVSVAAAAGITGVASLVVRQTRLGGKRYDPLLTAAIALGVGIAAAVVPVVRDRLGLSAAFILLLTIHAVDGSTFLIGSGARFRWEGRVAAAAAVAVLSLAASAVLVPPFRAASPVVLGAIAVVLAPLGPRVASALLPKTTAFAPALRRIDSLLVAGPVWALVGSFLLEVPAR